MWITHLTTPENTMNNYAQIKLSTEVVTTYQHVFRFLNSTSTFAGQHVLDLFDLYTPLVVGKTFI